MIGVFWGKQVYEKVKFIHIFCKNRKRIIIAGLFLQEYFKGKPILINFSKTSFHGK
jgi:hypothetical protein